MSCKSCQSENQRIFTAEMNIHFVGLKNLDANTVWVFPELLVCLDCGYTEFQVEERELRLLAEGTDAEQGVG